MKRYRPIDYGRVTATADDHLIETLESPRDAVTVALAQKSGDELIEIFKRNTRIAKTVGHAIAWFNGTEIRTVCDKRGRLLWRINNRPVSRVDALAFFA